MTAIERGVIRGVVNVRVVRVNRIISGRYNASR